MDLKIVLTLIVAMYTLILSCDKEYVKDDTNGEIPASDFKADITSIYRGDTILFTDLSVNNPSSWWWDFGDGETSKSKNPIHIYNLPGNFTVTLITRNENGSDTATKSDYISVNIIYGSVTDYDGNDYTTVTIGGQIWMAENLRVTRYNDGTPLEYTTNNMNWEDLTTGAYCWYDDDPSNKDTYGALYNYYTVEASNLCPDGWHISTEHDWNELKSFLETNGYNYNDEIYTIGKSLASIAEWDSSSTSGDVGYDQASNNLSGFNGLPAGIRGAVFYSRSGNETYWWFSNTYVSSGFHSMALYSYANNIYRISSDRNMGYSVRCVKN